MGARLQFERNILSNHSFTAAQKLAEAQKNLATHFEELQDINLKGQISGMRDAAAGMGSYSDVFQAWSDTHQKSVAVKRIRLFLVDETSNASDAKVIQILLLSFCM